MKRIKQAPLAMALALIACGGPFDDPTDVARLYWESMAAKDVTGAREYATPETAGEVDLPEEDFEVSEIRLMRAEVDEDEAIVPTAVDVASEELDAQLEFETILTRVDGRWLVDVERTNTKLGMSIMETVIGGSLAEMGETLGEALGEAMQGMMEGMAEGFRDMGRALEEGEREIDPDDPKARR